jgi:hypothetical protein
MDARQNSTPGMSMDPVIFDQIEFNPDPERLLKKMRLKAGTGQERLVLSLLEEGRQVGRPRAIYTIAWIDQHLKGGVVLDGIRMDSRILAVNLSEVHRVFPYLASSGRELYQWTQSKEDILEKFYAEEISQLALLAAEDFLLEHLKATYQLGKTSSLNPGSLEDWPITAQRPLFQLLGNPLEAIGVQLMDSMMMIPNQSVSGIRYSSETEFWNCELCPRDNCSHRRVPYDEQLLKEKYQ